MDIFIFVISAIVLYPVLGTVFGILLTLLNTDNLKLKIALLTFLRPIVYTSLFGFIFPSTFGNSSIWLLGFLIAVIARDILFGNQKFLSKLTVIGNNVYIEFIDALLEKKEINVTLDNVKDMRLSTMQSVADYPASLTLADNDYTQRFVIFKKQLWNSVSLNLKAPNKEYL